ncbi:MAG: iron-siderophore ABC transporter substrate-binding protein [Anaerocolumna sp.]
MIKLSKLLMITALVAVFTVGCSKGNDGATTDAVSEPTVTVTPVATEEPEATKAPATEEAAEPTREYPYTYVDAAGRDVVLEAEPVSVAVDYLPLWETLLMLDVTPVAATGVENYLATWDPFQGLDMGEIIDIGNGAELNFELLLEVKPDVILHQEADPSNIDVSNFEQIAPVAVFGPKTKMDWRLSLREVAKVVGKEAKAEEVIAEFDQKIADAREKLQAQYEGQTVMQISIMSADQYYVANKPVLYDKEAGLGLNAPEGHTTSEGYEQVSMEAIVAMDPDYIFVNVFDGDEAMYDELTSNSVWQSLNAVKEGHVVKLDGAGHANSGIATEYTVNKIIETLLGE